MLHKSVLNCLKNNDNKNSMHMLSTHNRMSHIFCPQLVESSKVESKSKVGLLPAFGNVFLYSK